MCKQGLNDSTELTVCTWRGDGHRQGYSLIAAFERQSYFWLLGQHNLNILIRCVKNCFTHLCETVPEKPVKGSV